MVNIKMRYIKLFEELNCKITSEKTEDIYHFVARVGNEKVGSLVAQYILYDYVWFDGIISQDDYDDLFDGDPYFIIEDVKVDLHYQRSGIGAQLMNAAIEKIKKMGIKNIVLNACPIGKDIPLNQLVKWYVKLGFKVFKNQGNNVIMIMRIK